MLTIRDEQINVFRRAALESFRHRLYEHLAAALSGDEEVWTSERIWNEVDAAIARAREFHLSREVDVARLAELFCTHLGGFSSASLPKEVLNVLYAYAVGPDEKLRNFAEWIQPRLTGSLSAGV